MAIAHFDAEKLQNIIDNKSILKEDQLFVHKREVFLKRIQTQQKIFIGAYKIFNPDFEYEGRPFKQWMSEQLKDIDEAKEMMMQVKEENPDLAAEQDARVLEVQHSERKETHTLDEPTHSEKVEVKHDNDYIEIMDKAEESPSQEYVMEDIHRFNKMRASKNTSKKSVGYKTLEAINNQYSYDNIDCSNLNQDINDDDLPKTVKDDEEVLLKESGDYPLSKFAERQKSAKLD